MMDGDFLQWLIAQGGTGGLAAFALWMLNRVWADALRREQERGTEQRDDKIQLSTILAENTKALVRLESLIEHKLKDSSPS
jgi:hypothetical protein